MVGELLAEIMNAIGVQAFNFDLAETTSRFQDFLNREKYFAFVARCGSGNPAGFIALSESYALYLNEKPRRTVNSDVRFHGAQGRAGFRRSEC